MQYLLDSNVVIDILRNDEKVVMKHHLEAVKGNKMSICSIIYYEVVRGFKKIEATKKLETFLSYCKNWEILLFDMKSIEKAIEIYVKFPNGVTIEDNDIYIAAIAMINNCTLVTANERHFSRIDGLNYVNWRDRLVTK